MTYELTYRTRITPFAAIYGLRGFGTDNKLVPVPYRSGGKLFNNTVLS